MITAGVIGYGYWGPNIVRNFKSHPHINLKKICDISKDRCETAKVQFPEVEVVNNDDLILNDKSIDLVAIITPVNQHYKIAKQALLKDKHVFIEKPMASKASECEELIELAEKHSKILMVDHTFLFTGSVLKMKEFIKKGALGNLFYYDSVRVNLGLFQHDVNVIWDLAPHDISIMNYLIDNKNPQSVCAVGAKHFNGYEDVAYLTVKFENDFIAHFHVNWLSPVKLRKTLVAGDKKMLVWDDLEPDYKIKIYDKGVEIGEKKKAYNLRVKYRTGEMMLVPRIENTEALKLETAHLVDCIQNGKNPCNNGEEGLKVIRILEASSMSLRKGGKEIKLNNN